ncbi:MAG: tetratricopeptide repeat-containing sensor histidine kinase [Cyclobacteriaceae bacterium]|nr:tetratricopeptide repeat-containing sensor histidine kinase [Cyclobacteriaceae bacterium]
MRRYILLLLLTTTSSFLVLAQNTQLDSLVSLLNLKSTTKKRVILLNEINHAYLDISDSSKLNFIKEAIALSKKIDYNEGLGTSYFYLGKHLFNKEAYDSALSIQLLSLSIRNQFKNNNHIADNYMNIGLIHEYQSNYDVALDYFLKALKIRKDKNDKLAISECFNKIAIIHKYIGNYNKSIEYFLLSLEIRVGLKNEEKIANSLTSIGATYNLLGEYEKAREYFSKSLNNKLIIEDKEGVSNEYNNIGITYFFEQNYNKALEYYLKSFEVRKILKNKDSLSSSHLYLGKAYLKLGLYNKSEEHLQKALTLSKEGSDNKNQMLSYSTMAELNKKQGYFEKAVVNMENYLEINKTINTNKQNGKISQMQTKYDINKKENEIALLQKENEIIRIIEDNNSLINNTFIIATIIISILIFTIVRSYWDDLSNNKSLKKQKTEIEKQNIRLRELINEKEHLMHILAHDLRSPLNQIEGLVKIISFENELLSDQQLESIKMINRSTLHSKELLSKILSVRSIDSAKLNLKMEEVDIKCIISDVVKGFEIAANNKNIKVKIKIQDDESLTVMADKNYTHQVIDNLISNAIKFSPLNHKIDVSLNRIDNKIRIEVIDQGPGITEKDKEVLFDKYQKLSTQPTGGEISTGLGLSIVKKYVDIMNGKVWYEDNTNKGAKFIVELNKA